MQRLNILKDSWRRSSIFFITASLIIIADQISKLWIRSSLAPGESTWDIGFLRLYHVQNTGAAFGIFQDHAVILTIIDIIGACLVLWLVLFMHRRLPFLNSLPFKLTLALILGGTIGNLIDRLSLGYVTDFIDFSFWATFNIADSSVVVGALLLAYFVIRLSRDIDKDNEKAA